MQADECNRLWVMDSGQVEVTIKPKQVCPPTLFIFDLNTDELVLRYPIPQEFIKQDSLYSNIRVDVRNGKCEDAYAYMTDVWRFGLVVFSLAKERSWRVTDHLFYPDPLASAYNLQGLDFEWTDGIFGMALSPLNKKTNDRIMYFHPMSSFREFYVHTSVIRNETDWSTIKDAFKVMGQSRGKRGHASASAMDRQGILFFNQVTRNSVGCWDSRKPYKRLNLGVVAQSNDTLLFPNDLKIDNEKRQSLWILSNKLPIYLYSSLNKDEYNFRILTTYTDQAVQGTICDPSLVYENSYEHFAGEEDCY